jgi:pimeloyl-ACP methyl ester carboxylesterase
MPVLRLQVGGVSLHVVDEGNGPAVLLLHGFPDSSDVWRHQIPALTSAGFRAIAPDLRGFGNSDRPEETEAYILPVILQDLIGTLDHLNVERAHVVGHDWGAAAGWVLAALHPERVNRLVALSVGHPAALANAGLDQREKSWYVLLFQLRGIAEELLTREDWKLFRDLVRHHPETEKWIKDLKRPGALTAGLNWYRANVALEMWNQERQMLPNVQASTLGVWSSGDAYLTEAQMLRSSEWVAGPWRYERVEGASHWMQLDQPERVNGMVISFLVG